MAVRPAEYYTEIAATGTTENAGSIMIALCIHIFTANRHFLIIAIVVWAISADEKGGLLLFGYPAS